MAAVTSVHTDDKGVGSVIEFNASITGAALQQSDGRRSCVAVVRGNVERTCRRCGADANVAGAVDIEQCGAERSIVSGSSPDVQQVDAQ